MEVHPQTEVVFEFNAIGPQAEGEKTALEGVLHGIATNLRACDCSVEKPFPGTVRMVIQFPDVEPAVKCLQRAHAERAHRTRTLDPKLTAEREHWSTLYIRGSEPEPEATIQ